MDDHSFEVGGRYRNEKGEYETMAIEGERILVRYDDGTDQWLRMDIQARIWGRIQDQTSPRPLPPRQFTDDEGLDTQPIGELVQTVIMTNFSFPYPEDITLKVCQAIEKNPDWLGRYHNLVEHFSSHGKNGKLTVNSSIGWYTKEITGMVNLGQVDTDESGLIQSYSKLGYPPSS